MKAEARLIEQPSPLKRAFWILPSSTSSCSWILSPQDGFFRWTVVESSSILSLQIRNHDVLGVGQNLLHLACHTGNDIFNHPSMTWSDPANKFKCKSLLDMLDSWRSIRRYNWKDCSASPSNSGYNMGIPKTGSKLVGLICCRTSACMVGANISFKVAEEMGNWISFVFHSKNIHKTRDPL